MAENNNEEVFRLRVELVRAQEEARMNALLLNHVQERELHHEAEIARLDEVNQRLRMGLDESRERNADLQQELIIQHEERHRNERRLEVLLEEARANRRELEEQVNLLTGWLNDQYFQQRRRNNVSFRAIMRQLLQAANTKLMELQGRNLFGGFVMELEDDDDFQANDAIIQTGYQLGELAYRNPDVCRVVEEAIRRIGL